MAPSERSASWVLLEVLIVLMLLIRLEDGSCLLTLACVSVRWRARRGQQFPQTVPLWTEAQPDIAFISPGEIMSVRFAAIAGTISFGGECKWARGTSRRRRFRLKDRKSVGVITGVRGGYDIDVRRFHAKGMVLLGHLRGIEHDTLTFASDLEETLAHADDACRHLLISVDDYIRQNGLSASEPSVPEERPPVPPPRSRHRARLRRAFLPLFGPPAFETTLAGSGYQCSTKTASPFHRRGITAHAGLYFLGLRWLHTLRSSFVPGADKDAAYLAEHIAARC